MIQYNIKKGDRYFFINGEFCLENIKVENAFTVEDIKEINDTCIVFSDGGHLLDCDFDKIWVLRNNGLVEQLSKRAA